MRSLQSTVTILAALALCCASLARADVSHLGYNRFSRPSSTRLQRLESNPSPYPAAGYRPNREFNLPREQPLFPLGNQQPQESSKQNNNGGFDVLSEPQQPELLYGAPARLRQTAAPARLQQQPQQLYSAPQSQQNQQALGQSQTQNNNIGFDNQSEPQRPDLLYGAPARFRQAPARLQQQPQLQQLYVAPQSQRLTAAQPARLTDNREDKEEDEDDNRASTSNNAAEASADIETIGKKEEGKKSEAPQNVATIAYYPAGAFGFVQPVSAAYVSAANSGAYVAAANSAAYVAAANSAAYAAGAPSAAYVTASNVYQSPYVTATSFVQQPYGFAAPAQLQAW